jgi:segregation and condensation protein B
MRQDKEVEKVMERLTARYEARGGGLLIRRIEKGYQLATRPELHEDLRVYFEETSTAPLSRAALETLTIIAYNQPITRGGLEIIRGVNSDSVLAKLVERGLVCEKGRSESPGRPMLYGTTELFLKSTGLSSLADLEQYDPGVPVQTQPDDEEV